MSASPVRRIAFLMFVTACPLVAQVSEKEEPADLSRALVLKAEAPKPDAPLADAAQTQVGAKDFSLAMTVPMPEPLRETILAAQIDDSQGWRLLVTADGALRIEARVKGKADPFAVSTMSGVVMSGSTHHVAVNILRDAAKPNAGIWLDGIELASGIVPPADLTTTHPLSAANGAQKIHLYQRSLSRPELLALWLDAASTGKPVAKHPAPPADGPRFVPQPDETIALIGGTEAVAVAESGELETQTLWRFPQARFHLRNLAWEGDTVFHQDRPMNFGDLPQQLRRVNATSVFVMFGRQECLDRGKEGLEEFKMAFRKLLEVVEQVTPNIVIIGPPPFEKKPPPLPDRNASNDDLRLYSRAMEEEAKTRGHAFARIIDAEGFESSEWVAPQMPLTTDGVQLSMYGVLNFEHSIAWELGIASVPAEEVIGHVKRVPDEEDARRWRDTWVQLHTKNRLWHDYWRPSNWAFLHGDRTQQPSSRDPVNPQLRFFPAEQEKYLPLIKEAEEKVYKLVEKMTKKLP